MVNYIIFYLTLVILIKELTLDKKVRQIMISYPTNQACPSGHSMAGSFAAAPTRGHGDQGHLSSRVPCVRSDRFAILRGGLGHPFSVDALEQFEWPAT